MGTGDPGGLIAQKMAHPKAPEHFNCCKVRSIEQMETSEEYLGAYESCSVPER